MRKLITLFLIAFSLSVSAQTYKTVTMALDTGNNVAKLRAGTQVYNLKDSLIKTSPKLSDFFTSGGSLSDSLALNNAIDFCYNNKIRYLNIDVNYFTPVKLTINYKRVLLIGEGNIGSNNDFNYGVEVGGLVSGDSRINRISNLNLDKLKQNNDTLKIVIFGVSIDFGYDYNPDDIQSYVRGGVDQNSISNSWYDYFINLLIQRFPNKKIKVFNRAIPGATLTQYNTPLSFFGNFAERFRTPLNQDSTWIDVIRDLEPDILINSTGMNDFDNYLQQLYFVNAEINAWEKIPQVVLLSTPIPNYEYTGDNSYRLAKYAIQSQQKFFSIDRGNYVIDVGNLYNKKVFGTDFNNFSFKESPFGFDLENVNNTTVNSSTGFTLNSFAGTSNLSFLPKKLLKDFSISFTFRRTNTFDDFVLQGNENGLISITPTAINMFSSVAPNTGGGSNFFNFLANTDYNINYEFSSNQMRVFVNDTLRASTSIPYWNTNQEYSFTSLNNTGSIIITNLKLYEGNYKKSIPLITQEEAWGFAGDGNEINHPSSVLLKEVYYPAVSEFVDDLYKATNSQFYSNGDSIVSGSNQFKDGYLILNAQGTGANAGGIIDYKMQVAGGNTNSYIGSIRGNSFSSASKNTLDFYVGDWNNNNDKGSLKMSLREDGVLKLPFLSTGAAANALFVNSDNEIIKGDLPINQTFQTVTDAGNSTTNNVGIGTTDGGRKLNVLSGSGQTPFAAVGPNGFLLVDNSGGGETYSNASVLQDFQIGGVSKSTITSAGVNNSKLGIGIAPISNTYLNLGASTTTISSFRMLNGVAPTSPISGDWWSLTAGLRTQTFDGTNTKDVVFSSDVLTSGRIPYATTGGLLKDESAFSYNESTNALTVNNFTITSGVGTTLSGTGNILIGTSGSLFLNSPAVSLSTAPVQNTDYNYSLLVRNGSTGNIESIRASGTNTLEVTGTSQNLLSNGRFIPNNASLVTLTLPTTAAVGDVIYINGKGAGLWRVSQSTGQIIHGATDTTTGTAGFIQATQRYNCITLVCIVANTEWVIQSSQGTITIN